MTNKLPEKLTLLRKHYGYSQGDIANKLHIPVTEYMNWENGNKVCSITQLKTLADLFHVSLDAMADNSKDIVIPEDNLGDSVNIPFLNGGTSSSMTQQMDVADNMMPVSSVLPADTQNTEAQNDGMGSTRTLNAEQLKETATDTQQQPTEKKDKPAMTSKQAQDKKKKTMILVGCISAVAVVLIVGLIWFFSKGSTNVSLSSTNRLAEGDKYTLYVDKNGTLQTYGTFTTTDSFKGVVQVSAYGSHALGLKSNGTVVSSDGNKTVDSWSSVTMVAAGNNHSAALTSKGTVLCTGDSNACAVDDWSDIKAVYAGNGVTIGLKKDGSLKVSGSINSAISNQTNVASITMNESMLSLTKTDGTVTSYAIGSKAVMSTSSWSDIASTAVGSDAVIGLKNDGTVAVTTSDSDLEKEISSWTNIRYIAAYDKTYVAVDKSGTLYGAGDNTYSQYGETTQASASASADATQLSAVKNIKTDLTTANLSIKWDTVENADYYEVSVTGMSTIKAASNSTSIATSDLVNGNQYTISVVACSDKTTTYSNSEASSITYTFESLATQLTAPANFSQKAVYNIDTTEWEISWDAVENADYYILNLDGGPDQKTTTNSIALDIAHTNVSTTSPTHNVQVTAYSNSTAYTTSDTTKTVLTYTEYNQDVTITFATKDGKYSKELNKLSLLEGTYKASKYFEGSEAQKAGYRLEDSEQTFDVVKGYSSLTIYITNSSTNADMGSGE